MKLFFTPVTFFLVCFFSLVFCFNLSFSQVSFQPEYSITVGPKEQSAPNVVAIGDINNDGLNDVLLVTGSYNDTSYDRKLLVYLQTSSGTIPTTPNYWLRAYSGANAIYVGDFNNDGLNDVVICSSDTVGIYYQNSGGKLNPVTKYYVGGTSAKGLNIGDLNHDGLTDIVVSTSDSLEIFYQKSGGFNIVSYPTYGGGYSIIQIGDMNYDGLPDVVGLRAANPSSVDIFTQNNSGLLNPYMATPANANGSGMAIGDFNNDGRTDIVTGIFGNRPNSYIQIWFQDTTAHTFSSSPTSVASYDCINGIMATDLDCDGKSDIIAVNGGWDNISVFSQNSYNIYSGYQKFSDGCGADWFNYQCGSAYGDINNDGKPDVVLAATYGYSPCNGILVLINNSACNPITLRATDTIINASCQNKSDGGATVFVSSGFAPYKYTWSTGQTTQSVSGLPAGNYTVTVTDAKANLLVLNYAITAPTLVPLSVTISTSTTCVSQGSNINFTASVVNGGANATYDWEINGVKAGLNSYAFHTNALNNGDTVTCVVSVPNGCVTGSPATSNPLIINVGTVGQAGVVTSLRDTVCLGTATHLSINGATGSAYQWQSSFSTSNFSNISGATSIAYSTPPLNETTFYRFIAGNGACADTSAAYKVQVVDAPATIYSYSGSGLKLFFSAVDSNNNIVSYSWDFGDSTNSTGQNPSHTFATFGAYYVCLTVYNNSNCSYTYCRTITLDSAATGVSSVLAENNWRLFPNPTGNYVFIQASDKNYTIQSLTVYDVLGRAVLNNNLDEIKQSSFTLNISSLADGIYYIGIKCNGENYMMPVIKQGKL